MHEASGMPEEALRELRRRVLDSKWCPLGMAGNECPGAGCWLWRHTDKLWETCPARRDKST